MSAEGESFQSIAKAEKELCAQLGAEFAAMIRAIEQRTGISITEISVTGTHGASARWQNALCTIVSIETKKRSDRADSGRDHTRAAD